MLFDRRCGYITCFQILTCNLNTCQFNFLRLRLEENFVYCKLCSSVYYEAQKSLLKEYC
jgi:hypothetical protein